MINADNKVIFQIGDLVVFSGISQAILNNQIGIVIGDTMMSAIKEEVLTKDDWYVVQFGSMKLIVNNTMIEKLEPSGESDVQE